MYIYIGRGGGGGGNYVATHRQDGKEGEGK